MTVLRKNNRFAAAKVDKGVLQSEVESRTQGSRPRPRTQKNPRPRPRTALPRTDPLEARTEMLEAKDGNARGPRPRTQAQDSALQKKRPSEKIFRRSPKKEKGLHKNFSGDLQKKMYSKKFFRRSTNFEQLKK